MRLLMLGGGCDRRSFKVLAIPSFAMFEVLTTKLNSGCWRPPENVKRRLVLPVSDRAPGGRACWLRSSLKYSGCHPTV